MKIEINVNELRLALKAVLPHAETSSTMPVLNTVQFSVSDGVAMLTATDRYTLGRWTLDAPEVAEDGQALISVKDAKAMLARLPKSKLDSAQTATLVADGDRMTFSLYNESATFYVVEGQYPKVDGLLKVVPVEVSTIAFNPAMLARFVSAQDRNTAAEFTFTGYNKTALVRVGDRFIGCAMPVRKAI